MLVIEKKGNHTTIRIVEWDSGMISPAHLLRLVKLRMQELWEFRELIQNLVARNLKVRYRNSVLGVVWSLLNPLLMMLVFTAVFTVMRGENVGIYPVFILVGLLPWQFFANSVAGAAGSVVSNAQLINKVYFPREILVLAEVLSQVVNFLIALLVLVPILLLFHIAFTPWLLLLPVMILIQFIFTLGIAFIVATVNVFYRDVQMIMEVALLAGFFLTPVFYSLDILPRSYELFGITWDIWRLVRYLNPMASIIANYRVIVFYGAPPAWDFVFRTFITAIFFLLTGLFIFYRYHTRFSEEV